MLILKYMFVSVTTLVYVFDLVWVYVGSTPVGAKDMVENVPGQSPLWILIRKHQVEPTSELSWLVVPHVQITAFMEVNNIVQDLQLCTY